MSFRDVVRHWTEERLLLLDKRGTGSVRYLLLAAASDCDDGASSDSDGKAKAYQSAAGFKSGRSGDGGVGSGSNDEGEDSDGDGDDSDGDVIPSFRLHEERADPLRLVHDFAACALDNALYVTGGFSVSQMQHLARTLRFDPTAQSWRELQPMARARCKHGMAILSGARILVAGGETTEGKITPSCEIYDPSTDQWSTFPRLPAPRCWLACAADGDDAYASGGYVGGRGRDDFWKYDSATRRWMDAGSKHSARLPLSLDRHCMFVLGKYVYVLGGVSYANKSPRDSGSVADAGGADAAIAAAAAANGSGGAASNETFPAAPPRKFETQGTVFCLNLRTLESTSAVAASEQSPTAASAETSDTDIRGDGDPYEDVAGGGSAVAAAASPVPPRAAKWIRLPDMSYARHSAGYVLLGDKVLVCGGTNAEFKCDVHPNELYDPVASEWRDEASLAAANIGSLTCARLTYTHTQIVRKALPKVWPLW